jgi:hypothetical protein
MISIHTVDPREIVRAAGLLVDLPVYAKAAVEGETLIAVWGLAWSEVPKRCWIFLHVENPRPGIAFIVKREARKCLRHAVQLGETEVYSPRDVNLPTSTKLMRLLGFEYFAHENDEEVWRWRFCHP